MPFKYVLIKNRGETMSELITVGQISKPHGVKGEVKILPLTDDVRRFRKLKYVIIDDKEVKIIWCKLQTDRAILKLEGIEDMNTAERFRNKYIKIRKEDAVKLPKDSYFIRDLIGCTVVDTDDKIVGKISDVIKTGSNDVYWVKDENKKEVLIPAIGDVVLEVNIEEKRVIIKPVGVWQDED